MWVLGVGLICYLADLGWWPCLVPRILVCCCYWFSCYGDFGCVVCGSSDLRLFGLFMLMICSYWLIVLCILRRGNHFAFWCCLCSVLDC